MAPLRYAAQFAIWQHCSYLVPAAEPHGEDGAVLDDDGERRREDDLGHDEEQARPRVPPHLGPFMFGCVVKFHGNKLRVDVSEHDMLHER